MTGEIGLIRFVLLMRHPYLQLTRPAHRRLNTPGPFKLKFGCRIERMALEEELCEW